MLELTRQEKRVLLFLLATGLVGIGVLLYKNLACRPDIKVVSGEIVSDEARLQKTININTAMKDELMRLPGIGPALADAVIRYRDAKGAFQSIDDIKSVSGIGPTKFERIKDYIRTE
jgi:comEA protein